MIVLITKFNMNPFLALIIAVLFRGLILGMKLPNILTAFQEEVAGVLGFIAIVLGLRTMLGKMMAESSGSVTILKDVVTMLEENKQN
ncbi:GntP family permease [Domibacillus sp. A3M-37]|nr:GntP family permease [Domibacillus sp. A3M-37]